MPFFITIRLVQNFHADVAEPNIVTVILQTNETFVIFATAIIQQFKCQRPFIFAELTCLQHISPLFCPQMIFKYVFIVLSMNHCTFINHNLSLVPFAKRLRVLRNCRNHVIQRSRLTIVVFTQFSIRMIGIIQDLIFRCGKEIPPAKYYVDVEMGELGKTVFLNPHAAAKAMVAEAKDKEKRQDNETDDV